jgi:hypothetical protein
VLLLSWPLKDLRKKRQEDWFAKGREMPDWLFRNREERIADLMV